jgi:DNA replication protein DnaC
MDLNIYSLIKNEYDRRRKKATDELEERKSELYYSIPRLEEIEEEINRAGFKYNKMVLLGQLSPDSAEEELAAAIDSLGEERLKLLSRNGYSSDYLTPAFICDKCSDTGIIASVSGDKTCVCYKQQLIDYIYGQSNLSIANNEGFKSFLADFYADTPNEVRYGIKKSPRRQILGVLENCKNFVENFDDTEVRNLLFSGPTGVGKTYMSGCIAIELMNRGYTVLYQTAPSLFNAIYEYRYKSSNDDSYDNSVYKSIMETNLLIIDDIGTESPSGMRYAELLNIMDTRCANDKRKPCKTIIATNIDLKKLFEYYDERVVSRITGSYDIFKFAGDDIRRLKNSTPG